MAARAAMSRWCTAIVVLLAAASALALPSRLPRFSWDTLPVYIHMCNRTGDFAPETAHFLAKFAMVTIEKGQGENVSECCAEDKILEAAKQVKAIDPGVHTLFYYNSVLDWGMYRLHQLMEAQPQRWNYNSTGGAIRMRGDSSFPQPAEGMLTFNFSTPDNRAFWASACINMTKTGYIDGCFSDRSSSGSLPGMSTAQSKEYKENHFQVLSELQSEIPGALIANNDDDIRLDAVMFESYNNDAASLQQLMQAVAAGRLVQVHAGYHGKEHASNCTDIEDTLASFLIGAGNYSYYGCSLGWYFDTWSHWNAEYDRPLGAPLGPAVKHGSVWTRRFARGTHVTFDEASGIGKIAWASALPSSLSSASSLSPAALKTAQRPSSPAAAGSRLVFGAPQRLGAVGWGLDAVVQTSYNVLAYGVADGAMLTRDGGKTFSACSAAVCGQIGDIYARPNGAVTAKPGPVHDYGTAAAKQPGTNWTTFTSANDTVYTQTSNGSLQLTLESRTVVFRGLAPAAQCGHFACPIRFQGTGVVTLGADRMLQTAIVWWGGNPKSPQATSIVAFVSTDAGYTWDFASVVANASDYLFSEEGPNEHDLAVLPNGNVLAVVRVDGGDGVETHPYRNYYRTVTADQGRTWSSLTQIAGVGSARPRLTVLGNGAGPLLLSGGRHKNAGTQAPLLWVDWGNTGENFEEYSLPYYHNLGAAKGELRFTSGVNTTTASRESTCYTSIVATGATTALVGYDVIAGKSNFGYVMQVSIA